VTEANVALKTERVTSGEISTEWMWHRDPAPGAPAVLTLGATGFWNDLHDAVGNVTLFRGPGTFPIVGFIAAGASGRQRLNIDRTRVQGVEVSAAWRMTDTASLNADYSYNDATIRRASVAPALVGKRVAQVPQSSASISGVWRARNGFAIMPRVRWIGQQFEDDENLLSLKNATVVDVGISWPVTRNIEFFVNTENVGDARIETGRSADGVVNVAAPRLTLFGLRGTW
jgi:outer membrane receptor protein involved in Fe transport